jgi:hypothetical protein
MKPRLLFASLLISAAILPARAENAVTWSMNQMYPQTQMNTIQRAQELGLQPAVPQTQNPILNLLNNAIWACSYSYCFSQTNFN